MRKLVAAAVCLLSLSLSVTTGRCIKEKSAVSISSGGSIKRCRELDIYRWDRGFV